MSKEFVSPRADIDFPILIEPEVTDRGGKKWSALLWFDKDAKILVPIKGDETEEKAFTDVLQGLVDEVMVESYDGLKTPKIKKPKLIDGDDHSYENKDGEEVFPHKGQWGFNTATYQKPLVIDIKKNPITDVDDLGYNAKGHVRINAYPWEYKGKQGISWGIGQTIVITDKGTNGGASGDPLDGFEGIEFENN